jgi:hypothetical protein
MSHARGVHLPRRSGFPLRSNKALKAAAVRHRSLADDKPLITKQMGVSHMSGLLGRLVPSMLEERSRKLKAKPKG